MPYKCKADVCTCPGLQERGCLNCGSLIFIEATESPAHSGQAGFALLCVSEPHTEPTSVKVQTIDKDGNKQWETIELPADGTPVETKGFWPPLQINT